MVTVDSGVRVMKIVRRVTGAPNRCPASPPSEAVSKYSFFILRRFALRFINSHSNATGVFRNAFLGNCRVDDVRQPR